MTAASGVAGGALGLLIALWRDRTFQSISLTILMVVFSVAGVEAFAIAYPTLEFMGVPLVEVLNPYRAMLAVLYPQTDQLTGVVRASSVVYISARLTFAAALVAFGTFMLRKWNPGRNEPRELREEGEVEAVETLVEIDEETAEEAVGVSSAATAAIGHSGVAVAGRRPTRRRRCDRVPLATPVSAASRVRPRAFMSPAEPTAALGPLRDRIATPGPTRSSGASSRREPTGPSR